MEIRIHSKVLVIFHPQVSVQVEELVSFVVEFLHLELRCSPVLELELAHRTFDQLVAHSKID